MGEKLKILLVDDDPGEHTLFEYALKIGNITCDVEHAFDGAAALDLLYASVSTPETRRFSTIILDLNMPGMNGRETLTRIKSIDAFNSIPVLILSSSGQDSDRSFCRDHGADDYIVKSVDLDTFSANICSILAARIKNTAESFDAKDEIA